MRCDDKFQLSNFGSGGAAAEKVYAVFGTQDVFAIAEKAGVKIIYEKWFPATAGEFHRKTKTIVVNENAPVSVEKIVAHELGHYFLREFEIKNAIDEEKFCDEFADGILEAGKEFHAK